MREMVSIDWIAFSEGTPYLITFSASSQTAMIVASRRRRRSCSQDVLLPERDVHHLPQEVDQRGARLLGAVNAERLHHGPPRRERDTATGPFQWTA